LIPSITQARNTDGADVEEGEDLLASVRRLTPRECERLQGFPDNWTAGQSDSRRYRQLGNAVCVPVAEWIGRSMLGVTADADGVDAQDSKWAA
jgi:site-specific DNA-cytosine methylase